MTINKINYTKYSSIQYNNKSIKDNINYKEDTINNMNNTIKNNIKDIIKENSIEDTIKENKINYINNIKENTIDLETYLLDIIKSIKSLKKSIDNREERINNLEKETK